MVGDTIQLDGQREGPLLKVLEKLLYTDETWSDLIQGIHYNSPNTENVLASIYITKLG